MSLLANVDQLPSRRVAERILKATLLNNAFLQFCCLGAFNQQMRRKVIVDTDLGFDDARAIVLLLNAAKQYDVEVVALTTVFGNVPAAQASRNARRLLLACGRTDIPIYEGASEPLVPDARPHHHPAAVHGSDGLGDRPMAAPGYDLTENRGATSAEPAAVALCRIVAEHPSQVVLLALGPLTNVALALSLQPAFASQLHSVYIMGGNVWGIGNVTASAEANFYCDPEAAQAVLSRLACPVTIAPWDLCVAYGPSAYKASTDYEPYRRDRPSALGSFLCETGQAAAQFNHARGKPLIFIDEIAAAALLDDDVILDSVRHGVRVQLQGEATRGQMLVQWTYSGEEQQHIRVITKYDCDRVADLLRNV